MAGDGNDTVFSNNGGAHLVFGGSGDDTIAALVGKVRAVPGPGRDTVSLSAEDDTAYIFHACEVEPGEVIQGGAGTDTLVIPAPLAEMQALGLSVSGFENIVVEDHGCWSTCSGESRCAAPPPADVLPANWHVTESVRVNLEPEPSTSPTEPVPRPSYSTGAVNTGEVGIDSPDSLMMLDYQTATLHAITVERTESGGSSVSPAGPALDSDGSPLPENEAWSDGTDDRVSMTVADGFPINHRIAGRIGKVFAVGWGTGTLVGRRLVITAAHVILPGGAWSGAQFATRADPSNTGGTLPYGTPSAQYAIFGGKWTSNNCPNNDPTKPAPTDQLCANEDWAVLVLPPWQGAAPAYAGYAWDYSESTMQTWTVRNAGYPNCVSAAIAAQTLNPANPNEIRLRDDPVQISDGGICLFDSLLGTSGESIGRFMYPIAGRNGTFGVSIDWSPGQSGSSVLTDDPGSGGPYVSGLMVTGHCVRCNAAGGEPGLPADVVDFPAIGPIVNRYIADTLNELREETQ